MVILIIALAVFTGCGDSVKKVTDSVSGTKETVKQEAPKQETKVDQKSTNNSAGENTLQTASTTSTKRGEAADIYDNDCGGYNWVLVANTVNGDLKTKMEGPFGAIKKNESTFIVFAERNDIDRVMEIRNYTGRSLLGRSNTTGEGIEVPVYASDDGKYYYCEVPTTPLEPCSGYLTFCFRVDGKAKYFPDLLNEVLKTPVIGHYPKCPDELNRK